MNTITPHTIIKKGDRALETLSKEYDISISGDYAIVSKEINAPEKISKESVDSITNKTNKTFHKLNSIDETITPAHVLVRTSARGRMDVDKPTGYIAELTNEGPIIHFLEHMTELPLLGGYGSLLDPVQLACNTESGDLRNTNNEELKQKIADQKQIENKVEYAVVKGTELVFSRAATAKRYGSTQVERNQWAVLNINQKDNVESYIVVFDPADLTENPVAYFARENFDEMEYARRKIEPEAVEHLGGVKLDKSKGLWLLDSPLVTDVDGKLEMMNTNSDSKISDRYINMITNGLVGAEKMNPGFAEKYMKNTIQANSQQLYAHKQFRETLTQKLA